MCRFMQNIFQIGGLCVVLYNTQYNTPESLVLWREYTRISGFMQTIHQNLWFYADTPECLVLLREYTRISGFMERIHQNLRFYVENIPESADIPDSSEPTESD